MKKFVITGESGTVPEKIIESLHNEGFELSIEQPGSSVSEMSNPHREELYRIIIENTGEGLGLVDTQEVFTFANPAACAIFGLPEETLTGKSLLSFLDPASVKQIEQQSQIRKSGEKSIYELKINRPDGETRWIIVTATPQYEPRGAFIGTFGIFRDITQRKLDENKLLESEKRLRQIVDLTNDWIWEINPQWRYTFVSNQVTRITGYTPEEMVGKTPFDFLFPEDVEKTVEELKQIVHLYQPITAMPARVRHKEGHVVYVETSGIPVFDQEGRYFGYRGADRDVTLRKLYEQELIVAKEKAEESDRLKSSILANISHELRTPLNGIVGYAGILREELRDTDYEGMAENIQSSGNRLMATLNSIIILSQLEAHKVNVEIREFSLTDCLLPVVHSYDAQVLEKKILMDTREVMPVRITTDEHLLKQLLRQLLDNAVKFTDRGVVRISSETMFNEGMEWVVIRITDTGIGIDRDYYEIIFQEFRQVSEGFGRKYQGSGIGLTISKKIIDLLRGKITLESEAGKGSNFSVWLPINYNKVTLDKEIFMSGSAISEAMEAASPRLPELLLVEDNTVNAELTAFFLHRHYNVDTAKDGLTAIEMAKSKKYVAILMDINLGFGMNGLETAREIRKMPGYSKIPVIAVTGYTMDEDRERILAEGCTHYVPKPFDKGSLLQAVSEALSESRDKEF